MTAKHSSPEWRRVTRTIRAQVSALWARDEDAECWRCGGPIPPGCQFDTGHIDPAGGEVLSNAAPEHRGCNRREGGRRGARITNARRAATSSTFIPPKWAQ